MVAVSQNQKVALDIGLSIFGVFLANLVTYASNFGQYAAIASLLGVVGGYGVSDLVAYVNTGQAPTTATVTTQLTSAWSATKTAIQANTSKMTPAQQNVVNLAIASIDQYIQTQTG